MSSLTPFTLLTGYLGSGKTTLLNRMLSHPHFRSSLVIINEFATVALDGMRLLVEGTEYVVLDNGCVCCTTRGDLTNTVSKALFRRQHGLVPPFERFVLETTGAADPYPLIAAFGTRGALSHLCHLEMVVVTVDGLLAERQLAEHAEVRSHVLAADHLVVTKGDLMSSAPGPLLAQLRTLNPLAHVSLSPNELDLDLLVSSGLGDHATGQPNWERWLRLRDTQLFETDDSASSAHDPSSIRALTVVLEQPVNFRRWCHWVAQYVQRYGQRVLRLKAILHTDHFAGPIAFDAVRDIVHAPVELSPRAVPDRKSRVVLLCQDIPPLELKLLEGSVRETQIS